MDTVTPERRTLKIRDKWNTGDLNESVAKEWCCIPFQRCVHPYAYSMEWHARRDRNWFTSREAAERAAAK